MPQQIAKRSPKASPKTQEFQKQVMDVNQNIKKSKQKSSSPKNINKQKNQKKKQKYLSDDSDTQQEEEQEKVKYHVLNHTKNQTFFHGYAALCMCVFIYIISCALPVIALSAFMAGWIKLSIFLALSYSLAYCPIPIVRPFKNWLREGVNQYFKEVSISIEEGSDIIDSKVKTMVPFHPHGIFCIGWTVMFLREEFERLSYCFSSMLNNGYFRLYCNAIGNPSSVGKRYMTKLMDEGRSVALIPGGFEEGSLTTFGDEQCYLNLKFGFVKLALKYGYSLTPVYGFKECFSFYNIRGMLKFRQYFSKWSVPTAFFWGNNFMPMLPKRDCEIHVVIGKSLKLPKIEDPTPKQVQHYHELYLQEVRNLFNRHKARFYENPENVELNIM